MLGSFHRSSQKKNPRTLALGHRIAYYQRQLTGILTEQIITGLVGIVNSLTTFSKAIASALFRHVQSTTSAKFLVVRLPGSVDMIKALPDHLFAGMPEAADALLPGCK
jgi:hypothetical protein